MKKFLFGVALLAFFGNCWGHTAEMTNRLVRAMLFNSLRRSCDRLAVDDEQIAFVETIVTNVNVYAMLERDMALVNLYQKMEQTPPTNDVNRVARTHVAQMMYRHRHIDLAGSVVRDMACVSCFDGYATSSNRLADAQFVLARSEGPYGVWSYFSTVTNQLLSTERPLVQLTIGEQ